jgi:integrase
MADRVRAWVAMVLDSAKARGLRTGDNPAQWRGSLKHVLPAADRVRAPEHHAALEHSEVPKLVAELRERTATSAAALRFTILTASRTSETIKATWSEIDLDGATWTVPGHRMKSGRPHVVPLAPQVVELLKSLPREADNPHIFPGHRRGKGLSNISQLKLLKSMRPGTTVHGMRAAFRTWVQEETDYLRRGDQDDWPHCLV